jgi:hypothetical protein
MNYVIYSPFPDDSFRDDILLYAKAKLARSDGKSKQYWVRYHDPRQKGALLGLGTDIRLYVMGHGDLGDKTQLVGGTDHWDKPPETFASGRSYSQCMLKAYYRYFYTPEALVDVLHWDGLQKYAHDVRLYACIAAKDSDSFAYQFAGEMAKNEHYPGTRVYGYTGDLHFDGGRKRTNEFGKDDIFSAKKLMVEVTGGVRKNPLAAAAAEPVSDGFDDLLSMLGGLNV